MVFRSPAVVEIALFICLSFTSDLRVIILKSVAIIDLEVPESHRLLLDENLSGIVKHDDLISSQ